MPMETGTTSYNVKHTHYMQMVGVPGSGLKVCIQGQTVLTRVISRGTKGDTVERRRQSKSVATFSSYVKYCIPIFLPFQEIFTGPLLSMELLSMSSKIAEWKGQWCCHPDKLWTLPRQPLIFSCDIIVQHRRFPTRWYFVFVSHVL